MRYMYDNDLHIHSKISLCSSDERQTNERILQYAKDNKLRTICLTNHFWDESINGTSDWYKRQNYAHIAASKPLPQADGIHFLFGCETEMDKNMRLGISKDNFDKFDFIIIPTTHMHMTGFTIPEDCISPQQKSELWLEKFNAVLDKDLPFHKIGIAHLTCPLIDPSHEKYLETVTLLSDSELEKVFLRASQKGVGIELNLTDMSFTEDEAEIILRPYKIAKRMGCKFYMGSDAHHPEKFDNAKNIFEHTIDLLELTENDKFCIQTCR